jgi:hypothetical protein
MKEDVLEQIVDDYLQFKGYFTIHNVRFKPYHGHKDYLSDQDRVSSDVDVVGYCPTCPTTRRVIVVSCKSWQSGFNPRKKLLELREGPVLASAKHGAILGSSGFQSGARLSDVR